MTNTHSKEAFCPYTSVDQPFPQGGQFIHMDFMASNSHKIACRRPWQKSMDSQEFGFASDLVNSMEVAPADELFFRGQLLPLESDPRLHLVQALSECAQGSRGGPSSPSLWCDDEEVIELISCGTEDDIVLDCKEGSMRQTEVDHGLHLVQPLLSEQGSRGGSYCIKEEEIMKSNSHRMEDHVDLGSNASMSNSVVNHSPHLEQDVCCTQGPRGNNVMLSCRRDEEFHSCRMAGDMGLDNKASTRNARVVHQLHLEQAPVCDKGSSRGPRLSRWCRDYEEISFNSCRMEGDLGADYKGSMSDAVMDLRSLSFRSQNSGFWESGADKDTGDSSSSSRDSNGSSQDSDFPNHTNLATPPFASHHPHTKIGFIPWKSLFKRASKKHVPNSLPIPKGGFSENLSKYKACATTPSSLNEGKEALLQWKLESEECELGSRFNQEKQGKGERMSSINDGSKSGLKTKSRGVCDAAKDEAGTKRLTFSDGPTKSFKGARDEEMKMKERSAAVKERWQGYARRLKPLCELKRGLMGQFRMDECGKRACEVESGTIYASSRSSMIVQRRLSHQSSLFKSHTLTIQQKNQSKLCPSTGNNRLAMSSCPPSTRSSPNHSRVLAVIDTNQKGTTLQAANCTKHRNISGIINTSNRNTNINIDSRTSNKSTKINKNCANATSDALPSSSYNSSMSTMHELHSALQGAIAHCKESNKKLNFQA